MITFGNLRIEFGITAVVWIPYSFLLFYLFREHLARSRNLQSNILLFLTAGAIFRCAWFWVAGNIYYRVAEVINRIALLLQFSGLSLLMLMWSRAIAISKMTDMAYQENHTEEANLENGRDASMFDTRLQRYQNAAQEVMSKLTSMNTFQSYIVITVIANFIVWAFVLGSLASNTYLWYDINIIGISIACFLVAVGTLYVGLRVSIALHVALKPVYLSSGGTPGYSQEQTPRCACMGQYGARCEHLLGCCGLCSLYAFIFNYQQSDTRQGLQMQREVLKVILSVSTITSFFFLVRSLCFMYRPVILDKAGEYHYAGPIGGVIYPFFFYQVPEMVPNLVIALGISPPNGILRIAARMAMYGYRVAMETICCGKCGTKEKLQSAQQSVFDSECASMSPAVRPSYLADSIAIPSFSAAQAVPTPALMSTSTPIAIPISRRPTSSNNAASTDNLKSKHDQEANAESRTAGPVPSAGNSSLDTETDGIVLSPVHEVGGAVGGAHVGLDDSAVILKTSAGDAPSSGAIAPFQVESGSLAASAESSKWGRRSSGNAGGGSTLRSLVGSLYARSSNSSAVSSQPGGQHSPKGRTRKRHNSSRRSCEDGEEEEEENQWNQQRRESAEIAEMLYRINSFSTSEITSGAQTLASSLTSTGGMASSHTSVDSNTITNSRRHFITDVVGGNRNLTATPASETSGSSGRRFRGWFS